MMRRRSPPSLPKTPAGAAEPSGSAKKRPKSTPPPDQPMLRGDVKVEFVARAELAPFDQPRDLRFPERGPPAPRPAAG